MWLDVISNSQFAREHSLVPASPNHSGHITDCESEGARSRPGALFGEVRLWAERIPRDVRCDLIESTAAMSAKRSKLQDRRPATQDNSDWLFGDAAGDPSAPAKLNVNEGSVTLSA